jgi:hypothetical protein
MNQTSLGDRVYTHDGKLLGTISEFRDGAFKLDAPLAVDFWLRTTDVQKVERGSVLMTFTEAQLANHRIEAGAL